MKQGEIQTAKDDLYHVVCVLYVNTTIEISCFPKYTVNRRKLILIFSYSTCQIHIMLKRRTIITKN